MEKKPEQNPLDDIKFDPVGFYGSVFKAVANRPKTTKTETESITTEEIDEGSLDGGHEGV